MSTLTISPVETPQYWVKHFGFIKVANMAAKNGEIDFEILVDREIWNEQRNFVYLIAVDGIVVKQGGSGAGLQGRAASFNTGSTKYNKSDNAVTNRKIHKLVLDTTAKGGMVEWYVAWVETETPTITISINNDALKFQGAVEYYHPVEKFIIDHYTEHVGRKPEMSNRAPRTKYSIISVDESTTGLTREHLTTLHSNKNRPRQSTKSGIPQYMVAKEILTNNPNMPRKNIIDIMTKSGIKKSTASSYYSQLRKQN